MSDEETGSAFGLQHVLDAHELIHAYDLVVVPDAGNAESTMIEVAEKSVLWLKISTRGRQCHASHPAAGQINRPPAEIPRVTLCRCLGIPARHATGYLGDIGVPFNPAPMDFSAWFEVYLGGTWYTFDARHNEPRIGRIVMAYGKDATEAALTSSFGPLNLQQFRVWTDEIASPPA